MNRPERDGTDVSNGDDSLSIPATSGGGGATRYLVARLALVLSLSLLNVACSGGPMSGDIGCGPQMGGVPCPPNRSEPHTSQSIPAITAASSTAVTARGPGSKATTASLLGGAAIPECFGQRRDMQLSHECPYTSVTVTDAAAQTHPLSFLIDYGSPASSIDDVGTSNLGPDSSATCARDGGACVPHSTGTSCKFRNFNFFGDWGNVCFLQWDYSKITTDPPVTAQAGIVGADLLVTSVFTLDYANRAIFQSRSGDFCDDSVLQEAGMEALSTRGFFSGDERSLYHLRRVSSTASPAELVPNVPTVTLRVGPIDAVAQLDSGFGDSIDRHSININKPLFDKLVAAGVRLEAVGQATTLASCKGADSVQEYAVSPTTDVGLTTVNGGLLKFTHARFWLKTSSAESHSCKGIATWDAAAAQLGNSFMVDSGMVVYDPMGSRVWISKNGASAW